MATKGKGKKEQIKSPPPPAEAEQPEEKEIVTGKITETDWYSLLSQEDGVDTVSSLIDEAFEIAFSIINAHYLEEQAFPYTVQDAKQSLLKIIEWQFLARDEGEKDTLHDPSWVEDEEPPSAIIDSWARGVVPQASETRLLSAMNTNDPITVLSREAMDVEDETRPVTDRTSDSRTSRPVSSTILSANKSSSKPRQSSNQKTSKTRRSRPVARRPQARMVTLEKPPVEENVEGENPDNQLERHPSSLHSHTPTSLTSLTPSHMHKRPMPFNMKPAQLAFQKGVTYDERGNIIDMIKLDPKKFPSHIVKPEVTIIKPPSDTRPRHRRSLKSTSTNVHRQSDYNDTSFRTTTHVNASRANKPAQKVVNEGVRTRVGVGGVGKLPPRGNTEEEGTGTYRRTGRENKRFPESLALPALIDTIDPVQGVTIRESGKTLHGPKRHKSLQPPSSPPRHKLRPIRPIDTSSAAIDQHSLYVAQTS